MATNTLQQLLEQGQSPWYDNIRRGLIASGDVKKLIDGGIVGMTANPTIFEKAIGSSSDYDERIHELVREGKNTSAIYEDLVINDIRNAADLLRGIYDKSNGLDGYISIEVSPELANDTQGTIAEAKRFYSIIDRPNIMIKIPATPAGLPAIEQVISEGINVNVTLIFSLKRHEEVARAYIAGLKKLQASGKKPLNKISSVASFFVSRVDTLVDKMLQEKAKTAGDESQKQELKALEGKIAIANAKLAYELYKRIFHGQEFASLKAAGANPQRCLWASTSTKNPQLPDVYYVEALIGAETVDTMPPQTVDAFTDHGKVAPTLDQGLDEAKQYMQRLEAVGISIDEVTQKLQDDGVKSFADSFTALEKSISEKREKIQYQYRFLR